MFDDLFLAIISHLLDFVWSPQVKDGDKSGCYLFVWIVIACLLVGVTLWYFFAA